MSPTTAGGFDLPGPSHNSGARSNVARIMWSLHRRVGLPLGRPWHGEEFMTVSVLGTLVFAGFVVAGLAAQGTEQTIMGCVKGDGTDANPWMLIGVVIPPPPPAAPAGGGGRGGRGGGRGGDAAPPLAAPCGARWCGGRRCTCGRRRSGGRRRWPARRWRRARCSANSSTSPSASRQLQAERRQHDPLEQPARRSHRHWNDRRFQRQ